LSPRAGSLLILLIAAEVSGCAIKHPTVLNESYFAELPEYSPSRKVSGSAVILMTREQEAKIHASRAAYIMGSGSEFSFEIGKITIAAAEHAASRLFEGAVTVVRTLSPGSTAHVLRPEVTALEWWYRPTKPGYNFQELVRLELTLIVERGGERVFSAAVDSGEVGGRITREAVPLGAEANRVVHHTVRRLMEAALNEFAATLLPAAHGGFESLVSRCARCNGVMIGFDSDSRVAIERVSSQGTREPRL
jgi:hypothetical protein